MMQSHELQTDTVRSLAAEANAITDPEQPRMLFQQQMAGPAMVGVARLPAATVAGLWERHDEGDELLVMLAGRMTATLRHADGYRRTVHAGPGDLLFIPRGVAHAFHPATPEVQLMFVTPCAGNTGWSEHGVTPVRHG